MACALGHPSGMGLGEHYRRGDCRSRRRHEEAAARGLRWALLSTTVTGLAGAFFAHHARFVSADSFRLDETFLILTMLIVGGMGSFLGPVIGAIALVILPEASRFLAEYRGVVYGLVLISVILFRPEGVAGVPGIIQPRGLLAWKTAPPGDGEPAR